MAKLRLPTAVLVTILPIFLAVPAIAQSVGLGVSDLDLKVTLTIEETRQFEVARVYNTGDLDLNITATWVPNYVASGILVEPTPTTSYLARGESTPVYLKVTARELGSYSGYVDFSCSVRLLENQTGNPSVPGGRAHATFNVAEKPQPTMSMAPIITIIAEIVTVVVGMVGILVWYYVHRGRRFPYRGHLRGQNQQ